MDYFVNEIRDKFPRMAKKADSGSRAAAIRIFCLTCMGGAPSHVKDCTAKTCPLYNYRLGHFEGQHESNDEPEGAEGDHEGEGL